MKRSSRIPVTRHTRWILVLASVIVAVTIVWLGFGRGRGNGPLRVGYLELSAAIPLFVALEQSLFEQEGIQVESVKYTNGATMAEDVFVGRLAAASPGPADVYLRAEAESPGRFRFYLQTAYTPDNYIYSLLVRRGSPIRSGADLRGKTLAVFPGVTNSMLCGLFLTTEFGLVPDSNVFMRGVSPPLQLDALEVGEFDALCPLEPTGTIGASRRGLEMIDRGPVERSVLNPLYITAHALSTAVMEERPDEVAAFVRAMERAVDLIRTDETGARRVLPAYTALDSAQAQQTPLGNLLKNDESDEQQFQALADLLFREGVISDSVPAGRLYYDRQ